jgi:hypothetical protein
MDLAVLILVRVYGIDWLRPYLNQDVSLQLLRSFYSEGLVDNTTFLVWLVQQMGSCNLAQAAFVTRLADHYINGVLGSRALTRHFIDACLAKLSEVPISSFWYYASVIYQGSSLDTKYFGTSISR